MSNKTLMLIFSALLLAFGAYRWKEARTGDRSFKKSLVSFQKDKVDYMEVSDPQGGNTIFTKAADEWRVKLADGSEQKANAETVNRLLSELEQIKPQRVAATNDQKWEEMKVAEGKGIRVILKENDKQTLDIFLGKFTMSGQGQGQGHPQMQGMPGGQQPQFSSYVRLQGDTETYSTDGLLEFSFKMDPKTIVDTTLQIGAPIPTGAPDEAAKPVHP